MDQPAFDQGISSISVVLPKDFLGVEEVLIPTEGSDIVDGGEIKPSDIEEVLSPSKENIVDGGIIVMRKHVTMTVLSLWVAWTLAGLISFMLNGNPVLLISSPAIMSIPLYKVLGYYF